ncbi:MAG: hypothetical protein ABWK00_05920 [Desulfurococcaceae archaeon]
MSAVVGDFVIERSRSRTGKHALVSQLLLFSRGTGLSRLPESRILSREAARPTYSRGTSERVRVVARPDDALLYVWLVRNFRGKVKGYITVFSGRGEPIYRARYDDGRLARSFGEPAHAWLVRLAAQALGLAVRETRLGDEGGARGPRRQGPQGA